MKTTGTLFFGLLLCSLAGFTQPFRDMQKWSNCQTDSSNSFGVTPISLNVMPLQDTALFTVIASSGWAASAGQPWCTVTPSGIGNDTLLAIYTANVASTPRSAPISVVSDTGDTVQVILTQSGLLPSTHLTLTRMSKEIRLSWKGPFWNSAGQPSDRLTGGAINPDPASGAEYAPRLNDFDPDYPGNVSDALWDLQFNWSTSTASQAGVDIAGDYVYTATWNSNTFQKYQASTGALLEIFTIPGVTGIRDLAYDGQQYWYGGSAGSQIYKMDFDTKTLVSTINSSVASVRHITYDPTNGGRLWAGGWNDIYLLNLSGTIISVGTAVYSAFGSAYDPDTLGPYLWIHAQNGSPPALLMKYKITGNTLTNTGLYYNLGTLPGFNGGVAGGLGSGEFNNKFVLVANIQQSPCLVAALEVRTVELANAPGFIGYNIYKDGNLHHYIDGNQVVTYREGPLSPGIYNYSVSAKYELSPYGYPGQFGESAHAGPVQAIITDTLYVGSDTLAAYYPYSTYWGSGRTQMLYKADELRAARFDSGTIQSVGFKVITNSTQMMNGFTIKIGATNLNSLTYWVDGLTTCYSSPPYSVPGTGWRDVELNTPFTWDGNSNVIVEICYANPTYSTSSPVYGSLVPGGIRGHYQDNNPSECSQTLSNTTTSTPRPNIRFRVTAVVVEPLSHVAGPEQDTVAVNVKTAGNWTATSHQSWCSVTPAGSGNGIINASLDVNYSSIPRTANITVSCNGGLSYEVVITQKGVVAPSGLTVTLVNQTATLLWVAPAGAVNLTGYNIYRNGLKINSEPVLSVIFTNTLQTFGTFKYTVTALYGSLESTHAGPVTVVITNTKTVGTGASTAGYPYFTYYMGSRTQMLYLASEITAAGGSAGNITGIGFSVQSASTQVMQNFTLKIGETTATSLTGWVTAGMNTVYAANYNVSGTGWRDIVLTIPFTWNGTSNLIVEICFGSNGSYTTSSNVYGTGLANRVWHYHADNYAGCTGTATGTVQAILPNLHLLFGVSASTLFPPPVSLTASVFKNNVTLNWTEPPTDTGFIGYYIYRNGSLITPAPVTNTTYPDQQLANGTYSYTVTAAYINGESSAIGPASATIALPAPPQRLVAASGHKNCIPLNWVATSADFYRIYRRVGTTGIYSLIDSTQGFGSFSPTSCYVDLSAEPGTTCFYKVTSVTGASESNLSNEVSAVGNITGFEKTVNRSEIVPVVDGIIQTTEWSDATQFAITNSAGVFNLPPSLAVTGYYKKVGNALFIGARDLADVTNNADELDIFFDNNLNQIFDGTDGRIRLYKQANDSVKLSYQPISGSFPDSVTLNPEVLNPPGIMGAMTLTGGHREYEIRIDLLTSPLHPVNNMSGQNIFTKDATGGYTGYWPLGHVWVAPATYARIRTINTATTSPITTIGSAEGATGSMVGVPLTLSGFQDITAFTLRLQYNPYVVEYLGYANLIPDMEGVSIEDLHMGVALHKLIISWSSYEPKSLSSGSKLLDLVFNYLSGTTALTWNNTTNLGTDCAWYGTFGEMLPDTPTENYYVNGVIQPIPSVNNLSGITVESGQEPCYNASGTINVSGNGGFFLVKPGGSVTMIAGQNILFMPGAAVQYGGYLHAYISSGGVYCNPFIMPVKIIGNSPGYAIENPDKNGSLFRVYPNPANEKIMIELETGHPISELLLYNLMGDILIRQKITVQKPVHELSLAGLQAGMYLVRLTSAGKSSVVKIIKTNQ